MKCISCYLYILTVALTVVTKSCKHPLHLVPQEIGTDDDFYKNRMLFFIVMNKGSFGD